MDMNQLADQVSNLADFVWNGLLLLPAGGHRH